ncbi:MAG: CCA tRNA nucleotidyltransferase [Rhodobacteraceae bacterium]|jgi:poly(A) polymerase|uniref:CCA tRNA nucleotidyltransferase n=1 Tax=Albidovulum sp. TaxID=1872424 RepID=UPI001DD4BFF7|nr:CCA tRNA nucleotidyltransferase [uncultured Defluviimonas sp.]MCB2124309.1 CCA tRNA nucleotidyltransferase [Paracoccaceae bacterium]MCC0070796.1 CCA tRNA nucleotidyltransferase [Paracoccaceae bacterium]
MRITDAWLKDEGLQQVLHLLTDAGHLAFLVGGCVRNALLGKSVADIDIATDAVPDRVTDVARAAGLKVVPTGVEHGTVTVVVQGVPHEVTTFRRDVETFGRHATVAFSTCVEEDAARRDFTMNALYADAAGRIVDPIGGLPDLMARRVRFVGDADARIREDYLRILRFFRFHAWYGDAEAGMDEAALAACGANSAGLDTLSRERIGHEMRRLLAAPDPAPALAAMRATGVLARVLPGADPTALGPLVHLEPPYAPEWIRRLAVLGGSEAEDRLRLSRAEGRRLATLLECLGEGASPAEIAYRHGAEAARDTVLLRSASLGTALPTGWEEAVAEGAAARFPLRAADLMPGLSGAALGERLKVLEDRWIASGFRLSREQLLA